MSWSMIPKLCVNGVHFWVPTLEIYPKAINSSNTSICLSIVLLLLPLDISMVIADSDMVVSPGHTLCFILYFISVWCSPLYGMSVSPNIGNICH